MKIRDRVRKYIVHKINLRKAIGAKFYGSDNH